MSSPSESSSALSAVDSLDLSSRATPPLGGLSLTLLSLEARRRLRNRRAMIFSVLLPVAFFLMFTTTDYSSTPYGNGNVVANMMIGMALYGALMTTTGAGAAVSTERASGWSRQLRLTPLKPIAYITAKAIVGMLISALAIGAVYACGPVRHAQMPAKVWISSANMAERRRNVDTAPAAYGKQSILAWGLVRTSKPRSQDVAARRLTTRAPQPE
nr:ABC transporter permease [uncultured Actinomyces sp.]